MPARSAGIAFLDVAGGHQDVEGRRVRAEVLGVRQGLEMQVGQDPELGHRRSRRLEDRRSHRDELSLFAVCATVADLADPGAFPVDDAGSAEVASGDGPHGSETGFDGPGRSRHLRRSARPASFAGGRTPCDRTTRIAVTASRFAATASTRTSEAVRPRTAGVGSEAWHHRKPWHR